MKYGIPQALQELTPGAQWVLNGDEYSGLTWLGGNNQNQPTEDAILVNIEGFFIAAALTAIFSTP